MNFTDINWLVPALKCLGVVVGMGVTIVALAKLLHWMNKRRRRRE